MHKKVRIPGDAQARGSMNMTSHKFKNCCKNAVGTIFLLGGAFLTCSTLLSMRAALADPIAPANAGAALSPQAMRAGNAARSGRASPRSNTATTTVSRGTNATGASRATPSRGVATRTTANRSGRTVRARNVDVSRVSHQGAAIRGSKVTNNNYTYLTSKLYTGNYSNIICKLFFWVFYLFRVSFHNLP